MLLWGKIMSTFYIEDLLELESTKSFDYFWHEANCDCKSPGYGLIRDRAPSNPRVCSIAAVGFGLTAIVIGTKRGWVSYDEAYERVLGTMSSLINNVEHINGFFYHFLDILTGKRIWQCEVSIIDTAILLCGAITAGEYFGGEIMVKMQTLYERMNWEWFRDKKRNMFYLGYSPEEGFFGSWDSYAEQFMAYFLAFASPTYPVNPDMFYDFSRDSGKYNQHDGIICSFTGALFTYQFSHAWYDLRNKTDKYGVDWWENSVIATKAARQYCIDNASKFKTFGTDSWGLTACDGPFGYSGAYGAPPRMTNSTDTGNDGTVSPCASIGSIVFTPKESMAVMESFYRNYPMLWGKYGFKDAYNLDVTPTWFASDFIGIDKGISLLMIDNYRTGFIWDLFMKNKFVIEGLKKAGFKETGSVLKELPIYKAAI